MTLQDLPKNLAKSPGIITMSVVTNVEPADPLIAHKHFKALLSLETDCWDVNHAITNGRQDFVLLDVRDQASYQNGHVETAVHFPHTRLNEDRLAAYDQSTIFVVYCAGPHCNGADKAALRLAKLNRPVKKMIGGITGWLDEGLALVKSAK